jgi:hypothetical protein
VMSEQLFCTLSCTDDKTKEIVRMLGEISSACSGVVPWLCPTLNLRGSSNVKTPNIILTGVYYLIQVIRRLLEAGDKGVHSIFETFLKSGNGQSVESPFVDSFSAKQLFGVFAVLSNVIVEPNLSYFFKIDSSPSTYLMIGIKGSFVKCFKLPISEESVPLKFPLSKAIPVSTIPFRPTLFPEVTLLIPYFIRFMQRQNSYEMEFLSFYVIGCMAEYINDPYFCSKLTTIFVPLTLSNLEFTDSSNSLLRILKMYLSMESDGINSKPMKKLS